MRLIDADRLLQSYEDHDFIDAHVVWNAPTVDAVEVIRCKDCIYYRQYAVGRYDCDNLYGMADAHKGCFCSRAERRKENG